MIGYAQEQWRGGQQPIVFVYYSKAIASGQEKSIWN